MNSSNKRRANQYFRVALVFIALTSIFFGVRILLGEEKSRTNTPGIEGNIFPIVSIVPTGTLVPSGTDNTTGSVTPSVSTSVKPTGTATVTTLPKNLVTKVEIKSSEVCVAVKKGTKFPYTKAFVVTGEITTNGPGKVTYRWSTSETVETLVFTKAEKKSVKPKTVTMELPESAPNRFARLRLLTLSPKTTVSNTVELALYNNIEGNNPCR